jgi:hypothetical protein
MGDVGAERALIGENETFYPNDYRIIRFQGVIYLLEKIRKEFTKEIHKAPTSRHIGID